MRKVDRRAAEIKREAALHQYDAANFRRFNNFTFFWQSVAIGILAQSFLLSVSLGASTSSPGRYIACGLSTMASLASLALMHSQRRYQRVEAQWMDGFEKTCEFGFPFKLGHDDKLPKREEFVNRHFPRSNNGLQMPLFANASKYWMILSWGFIFSDIAIVVITISHPEWLAT